MLTTVTITGADDGVDPRALVALAQKFPFVEWGILFSVKRTGEARYPSKRWLDALIGMAGSDARLSAHLCGAMARDTMAGDPSHVGSLSTAFSRVQINGWVPEEPGTAAVARRFSGLEFILQARSVAYLPWAANYARNIASPADSPPARASVLFDPSGGRGEGPAAWPRPPSWASVGFAGGINPDNVARVIADVTPIASRDFWIDMESGVRDPRDNAFDLGRVHEVLRLAAPFVSAAPSGKEPR